MERASTDYYSRRAGEYDEVYLKPERQHDLRELERRLPEFLVGRDVLEIACGTGYWSQWIARRARSMMLTDASPAMLDLARRRLEGQVRARFALADAYTLEGVGAEYTGAFLGFWWSHVPRSRAGVFLDVLHARLSSGARVVLVDNRYVEGSSTPIHRIDAEGNTYQLRKMKDGGVHEVLKNFPTQDELAVCFNAHGRNVHIDLLTYYWAVSCDVL